MKLYSYSREVHTFVEAKWITAKCTTAGIIIGTIVLFGVIKLNQSVDQAFGFHSANTLAAENDLLR
jgi:hypothetical protein